MKKLLSFAMVFVLCFAPFNGNSFVGVKTQALNIPIKTSYTSFSSKERLQIDSLSSISDNLCQQLFECNIYNHSVI